MDQFTPENRRRRLVARHRLGGAHRCRAALDVVDGLLAIHSSDPATVFLTISARLENPSIEAIEDALYRDRALVRHHSFRRTIWVMRPAVAAAAHVSATAKIAAVERRNLMRIIAASDSIEATDEVGAAQWAEEAIGVLQAVITENGPTTTREIGRRCPTLTVPVTLGAGTKNAGEAAVHTRLLQLAGFEARLVRTAPVNGWNTAEYAWSETAAWLGVELAPPAIEPDLLRRAAAQILQAWLERFGPATETDIRWWTGWTVAQMRAALADVEAEQVSLGGERLAWIAAGDRDTPDTPPSIALLPGLDATTMGWKERDWYLSSEAEARTFDRWGNAGPTIWRNGEVVGGWAQRADGTVAHELFVPLSPAERAQLDDEIDRFVDVVGETRVRVRFPAPNQRDLLA